jgi:hypothetical protein
MNYSKPADLMLMVPGGWVAGDHAHPRDAEH